MNMKFYNLHIILKNSFFINVLDFASYFHIILMIYRNLIKNKAIIYLVKISLKLPFTYITYISILIVCYINMFGFKEILTI